MIIWKGWGILALIIAIVCSVLMQFACDALFGSGYYRNSSWAMPLAFLLASGIIFFVGTKLNNKLGRVVIDKETNQEYELKSTHSLFWIPLQYWSAVTALLAVWMFIAG